MSIKINGQLISGKYKADILPNADTLNSGKIRIATQSEINTATDNTTAVTPYYLSTKQDKLTAGENINIENNIIKNKIKPDQQTIIQNEDGTFTTVAEKTKSNEIMISWTGTLEEYETGLQNGTIMPEWYCYITDDEQIVDYTSLVTSNEFEENKNLVEQQITELKNKDINLEETKANIDLNNLSENGEKHFLNKNQITNCILEVPQRIKYELADGTLTIKAGSVVIVPYGTEDLTAQYPVGATFINDNFKVYDTQFEDGKFFVWTELVNDLSSNYTSSTSEAGNRAVYLIFNLDTSSWYVHSEKIEYCFSGTEGTTTTGHYSLYYNTDTNLCARYNSSAQVLANHSPASLPCLVVYHNTSTGTMETVPQVFNGMGYIGSTVWVDKGVKGLIPDGRNEDGSLNNTEIITTGVKTRTLNTTGSSDYYVAFNPNITWTSVKTYSYDEEKNMTLSGEADWSACVLGRMQITNSVITSFQPKLPFRAADEQDIDGMWNSSIIKIQNKFTLTVGYNQTFDLSNYLPNDRQPYLVLIDCIIRTGTGIDNTVSLYVNSSASPSSACLCRAVTRVSGKNAVSGATVLYPVGADHKITFLSGGETNANSYADSCDISLNGYRRIN